MAEQELFNLVEIREDLHGYFVDRDLNVWSTKKGPTPTQISPNWGPRGKSGAILHAKLMDCKAFVRFLNAPPKVDASELYYVAMLRKDGTPAFSSMPKVHYSEDSARQECERLAHLEPGTSFAYFHRISACACQEITWS